MTEVPPPPGMGAPAAGSDSKNSLGIWALVLGILSIVCCGLLAGIPAIILGYMSKQAAARGEATNGNLGNIGFILGIIGTVLNTVAQIVLLSTGGYSYSF